MIHSTSQRCAVASVETNDCLVCIGSFCCLVHGYMMLPSYDAQAGNFCRWEGQR